MDKYFALISITRQNNNSSRKETGSHMQYMFHESPHVLNKIYLIYTSQNEPTHWQLLNFFQISVFYICRLFNMILVAEEQVNGILFLGSSILQLGNT